MEVSPNAEFKVQVDGRHVNVAAPWILESPMVDATLRMADDGEETHAVAQYLNATPDGLTVAYLGTKYQVGVLTRR